MADNFVSTSFEITLQTDDERNWWEKESARLDDAWDRSVELEDYDPPLNNDWEFIYKENCIWFHSEESFNVDSASLVVQRFLKECRPNGVVGFTWAETCSKPRLDEFGGGACCITANEITFMNTHQWLDEHMKS